MEAKDVRNLMEAYASVYDFDQEELNEGMGLSVGAARAINAVLKPVGQTLEQEKTAVRNITKGLDVFAKPIKSALRGNVMPDYSPKTDTQKYVARRTQQVLNQDISLFDIIKGHLLDEGYADSEESALAIMANMSEEWKQSIVEVAYTGGPVGRDAMIAANIARARTASRPIRPVTTSSPAPSPSSDPTSPPAPIESPPAPIESPLALPSSPSSQRTSSPAPRTVAVPTGRGGSVTVGKAYPAVLGGNQVNVTYDRSGKRTITPAAPMRNEPLW